MTIVQYKKERKKEKKKERKKERKKEKKKERKKERTFTHAFRTVCPCIPDDNDHCWLVSFYLAKDQRR